MLELDRNKKKIRKLERKVEILEEMFENQTRELYISNQELLSQNKELDQFAYIVSHDLKSPLRAIHSLSQFIQEDIKSNNVVEVLNNLLILQGRVLRMEGLINGILSYSQISMVQLENTSVNMESLISKIIENQDRAHYIEIKIKSTLPIIYGVSVHYIQLFSNLIDNAVKFNDKAQGSIVIDYKDLGTEHQFLIQDNGPGIPKKFHDKIFVPFQTLNSRDSIESTGIGLSIVKKIIDKLNGSIRVESNKNKGTKFMVLLPKTKKTIANKK